MPQDTFRKHCWLVAFVVTFTMLLSVRGMGLMDLMSPADVHRILVAILSASTMSILIFTCCLSKYTAGPPSFRPTRRHGSSMNDYGTMGMGPVASRNRNIKTKFIVYFNTETASKSMSYFLSKYSLIMAVYIFGGGSIVLYLFDLFSSSQCLEFFDVLGFDLGSDIDHFHRSDEISQIASTVTKLVFVIIEIPFLSYISTLTHTTSRTITQFILLPIMGANFALWLFTFLNDTELLHIFNYTYPDEVFNLTLHQACLNHSSLVEVYTRTNLENIFYAFSMEFCLTSMEILYHVFFMTSLANADQMKSDEVDNNNTYEEIESFIPLFYSKHAHCEKVEKLEMDKRAPQDIPSTYNPATPLLETSGEDKGPSSGQSSIQNISTVLPSYIQEILIKIPKSQPRESKMSCGAKCCNLILMLLHPSLALILGLIEASFMIIFLLHSDYLHENPSYVDDYYITWYCKIPLILYRIFANAVPLLAVTSYCVHLIRQFQSKWRDPPGIKWSILLSLVGITVHSVFQVAGSISEIKHQRASLIIHDNGRYWLYYLAILETSLYWPQFFVQAFLIYHGRRRQADPDHPQYDAIHRALSYLAMNNFVHWGINSFLETRYLTHRVTLSDDNYWEVIVNLGMPTSIYFRYISTFLLLEIKHLLWKSEEQVTKWQPDLMITPACTDL